MLDGPKTDAHLNYLDLMQVQEEATLLPHAVAEFQGRPLLYLIDALESDSGLSSIDQRAPNLGQLLANRSEPAMLGIVRPGELTLYPINLDLAVLKKRTASHTICRLTRSGPVFSKVGHWFIFS